ncbi:MAG: DUF4349 domain-containing protein [Blastocatellia bacterium]
MRCLAALFLTGLMIALSACNYSANRQLSGESSIVASQPASTPSQANSGGEGSLGRHRSQPGDALSARSETRTLAPAKQELDSAASAQAATQAAERKIIRNAEITIETDTPNEGQRKIAAIADKHGGFVVISESRQNEARSQAVASTVVNVVVRVPAQKFEAAIQEIRAMGGRILHEKSSGQDVTEEYIDLEARIRTKRALEAQFLEIMKQARKISDALEVQTQLAEVRTEIEQLEGRRRFLENQSTLSTINITLHTPTPVVAAATRGFFYDLKTAFGDGVGAGAEIFLGIIRFVIVMIPVTLFILLPAWFVFKWMRRRITWPGRTAPVSVTNPSE